MVPSTEALPGSFPTPGELENAKVAVAWALTSNLPSGQPLCQDDKGQGQIRQNRTACYSPHDLPSARSIPCIPPTLPSGPHVEKKAER